MKKCLLSLILVFSVYLTNAQKQTFENPETFITDLRTYMKIALSNQEIVTELDSFQSYWESGQIEEGYKFGIILTSNIMANRNAKPQTHFYHYIKTINGFVRNNRLDDYMEWEVGLIELLDVQYELMSKIATYLEFSSGFTNGNFLSQSPSITWKANSTDFYLINDVEKQVMTVELATFDLTCFSKSDTFTLAQTKGIFYPVENKFVGKGGMMTWERIGLSSDSVFAIIQDYEIDMKVGAFQAENVSLTNKHYLKEDVLGSFEDKLMSIQAIKNPTFPKFYSYEDNIIIADILPNINYQGSFNMEGRTFLGKGSDENFAFLHIIKDGENFINLASTSFNFVEDEVNAINTFASIRISEDDSIYHMGLNLEYDIDSKTCNLNRVGLSLTESPFIDTYHELNIYSGQIKWTYGDSSIYVYTTPKTALQSAKFESNEYFSISKYNALLGYETVHPLVTLKSFFMSQATMDFYCSTYAAYINKEQKRNLTEDQVHIQLYKLAQEGFIKYNPITRYAEIQQKMFDFIGNKTGKKDYDGIEITSELTGYYGVNGIISLNTLKLDIINPKPLAISETKRVGVFADTITVEDNKNMSFNGHLRAGLADFYGKNFYFEYDSFTIASNEIDSLTLIAQSDSLNKNGTYDPVYVQSTIEKLSGKLKIDSAINKAGEKGYFEYPKFESNESSFVYYDKMDTAKYNREKFYFEIKDLEIDSLNSITKSAVDSKGKFVSGLFPDFNVTASVQDDYSLGFIQEDTVGGFEIFDGKYYGTVQLNNSGLSGHGTIEYLTTSATSKDFTFYPDSVTGNAEKLTIKDLKKADITSVPLAEDEFPDVYAENSFFHWKPFEGRIEITNTKKGFTMYESSAVLNGEIEVSTTGLTGNGGLLFSDGYLTSETYDFKNSTLTSDTTAFNLTSKVMKDLPFKTDNVTSYIDVDAKKGTFTANSDSCKIVFPLNEYECKMDHFIWDIGKSAIDIGAGLPDYEDQKYFATTEAERDSLRNTMPENEQKKVRLTGSWFTSINENQDSLRFYSGSSTYSVKDNLIIAKNVPIIEVADASVYPSDFIYIEKKAKLRPLLDCEIIASRDSQFHTVRHATAHIFGKYEYGGSGEYTYEYENQKFNIDTFYVDTIIQTIGFAKILEKDSFLLSPYFTFYGDVELFAQNKSLNFSGYTAILNECDGIANEGIKFETFIHSDSIYIPINEQVLNKNKRQLSSGFYMKKMNPEIYTAFTSPLDNQVSDKPIISVGGYLFFDEKDSYYKIASLDKLQNIEKQGNYLSLHKKYCFVYAEGELDLNANLGEVQTKTVGNARHKIYEKQIVFNTMLGVSFYFLDKNVKLISNQLIENFYLEPVNASTNSFTRNLTNWVGEQRSQSLSEEILYFGQFDKVPVEFEPYTIMFSDIRLYWDTITTSYRSIGQLGISNIYTEQINRYVDGYVEIKKRRADGDNSMDEISIYIETSETEWYYFFYRGGVMAAISSNTDFNNSIYDAKGKELKIPNYEIVPGNAENAFTFKKTFVDGVVFDVDDKVIENMGDDGSKPIKPVIKTDTTDIDEIEINFDETDEPSDSTDTEEIEINFEEEDIPLTDTTKTEEIKPEPVDEKPVDEGDTKDDEGGEVPVNKDGETPKEE